MGGDSGSVHSGRAAEDYTVAGSKVRSSQRGRLCCSSYAAGRQEEPVHLSSGDYLAVASYEFDAKGPANVGSALHVSHQFSDGETLFGDDSQSQVLRSCTPYRQVIGAPADREFPDVSAVEGERRYGVPVNGHSKTVGEDRAVLAVSPGVGIEMPRYQ